VRLRSCASSMISVSYAFSSRSALGFGEQDAVGHELDVGVGRQLVGKTHFVAHGLGRAGFHSWAMRAATVRASAMLRRLVWPIQAGDAALQFEADLGQLRGLARAGSPQTMTTCFRQWRAHLSRRATTAALRDRSAAADCAAAVRINFQ